MMQELSDLELIRSYADSSDETAYATLMQRHQKMVFRVCLRKLGNIHDAENATQATFLVLSQKAGSFRREHDLSGWLYTVARNVALEAVRQRARCAREKEAAMDLACSMGLDGELDERSKSEVFASLDDEVAALPGPMRQAIILRYLEGYSQEESARLAGCPLSSFRQRASRGLEKLRERFERRGLALGGVALLGILEAEASATMPEAVLASMQATAKATAAGSAAASGVPDSAAMLAKGVLKTMLWTQVKLAVLVTVSAAAIGGSAAMLIRSGLPESAGVFNPGQTTVKRLHETGPAVSKGILAGLPSTPGPHIEKIKALSDNQWLNLGQPAPDAALGRPRERSWASKMPLAPDLRGAFLFGEAVRGYVKPDGYYMDDLWFYDINAHRWICLYPGLDTKNFARRVKNKEFSIDASGVLLDRDGRQLPQHTSTHIYDMSAYDPDSRQFAWIPVGGGVGGGSYYNAPVLEEGLAELRSQGWSRLGNNYSPWFYDVTSGQFRCYPAAGLAAGFRNHAGCSLLYTSVRKQFVALSGTEPTVVFFDPAARRWLAAYAKGPSPQGGDHLACYDSRRDRVYMGGGIYNDVQKAVDNFFIYDLKTATWSRPNPTGKFPQAFTSNSAFLNYDVVNDAVVLLIPREKSIYVYSPEVNTWSGPMAMPEEVGNGPHGNGFYDPELNAYFFHMANGPGPDGTVWVYRFKKGAWQNKVLLRSKTQT